MTNLNKKERLQKIIDIINRKNGASKQEISSEIGISITTASRDIRLLRDMGHGILCKSGRYKLTQKDAKSLKSIKYSMSQKRKYNLLWYISEKGFCTEKEIKDCFIWRTKDEIKTDKSKFCPKTLKNYLKNLIDQGLIVYDSKSQKEVGYRLAEKQFNKQELPVELCVQIIEFIRTNNAPLPFDNKLQTIVEKFENGIVKSISGNDQYPSADILNSIGLSYKLFTDGKDNDVVGKQEQLLFELDRLCQSNSFAEIWLKGKVKPLRHFCLLTVCRISLATWYVVVKTHRHKRPYSLIRVDRIEKVNKIESIKPDKDLMEKLISAKNKAYDDIVGSFGLGLGGKVRIKLKLYSDKQMTNNIIKRLQDNIINDQTVYNADGTCTLSVLIDGVPDFMHWLRGFGSKVLIVEPEYLRRLQYEEAFKLMENYMEGQHEKQL